MNYKKIGLGVVTTIFTILSFGTLVQLSHITPSTFESAKQIVFWFVILLTSSTNCLLEISYLVGGLYTGRSALKKLIQYHNSNMNCLPNVMELM